MLGSYLCYCLCKEHLSSLDTFWTLWVHLGTKTVHPRHCRICSLTGQKSQLPTQNMHQQNVSSEPVISQQASVEINVCYSHSIFVTFPNSHLLTMDYIFSSEACLGQWDLVPLPVLSVPWSSSLLAYMLSNWQPHFSFQFYDACRSPLISQGLGLNSSCSWGLGAILWTCW